MRIVIALGGNALLRRGEPPEAAIQAARLAATAPGLVRLADQHEVVLVHGNGPQVGLLARESADDRMLTAPYPLGMLSAATQGLIGSSIQQALRNGGLGTPTASLITHAVVTGDDPAIDRPEKFIGAVYDKSRARELTQVHGWSMAPDAGGWRRVVPSPRPRRVIELDEGRRLLEGGTTVIMGGGGGVPIVPAQNGYDPIDAVIDKDHTAALLAIELGADLLAILTDVPGVISGYGTPDATVLADVTPADLRDLDLPAGSMGPKAEAACDFTTATGQPAMIGPLEDAENVIAGNAGTRILAPSSRADGSAAN